MVVFLIQPKRPMVVFLIQPKRPNENGNETETGNENVNGNGKEDWKYDFSVCPSQPTEVYLF